MHHKPYSIISTNLFFQRNNESLIAVVSLYELHALYQTIIIRLLAYAHPVYICLKNSFFKD